VRPICHTENADLRQHNESVHYREKVLDSTNLSCSWCHYNTTLAGCQVISQQNQQDSAGNDRHIPHNEAHDGAIFVGQVMVVVIGELAHNYGVHQPRHEIRIGN